MKLEQEEEYLMQELVHLRESFVQTAKPIVDRLVRIRSMRVEPMYVDMVAFSKIASARGTLPGRETSFIEDLDAEVIGPQATPSFKE